MSYVEIVSKDIITLKPDVIFGVCRGGVIPAIVLSHYCNIPVIISQSVTPISSKCSILIVDDVFETGATVNKAIYDASVFTSKVYTMCLVVKTDYCKDYVNTCSYFDKKVEGDAWILFPWEDPSRVLSDKKERKIKSGKVNSYQW